MVGGANDVESVVVVDQPIKHRTTEQSKKKNQENRLLTSIAMISSWLCLVC